MPTDRRKRLLVVDGQFETAEVLRAIFEPRGMEINCVKADSHLTSSENHDANVIVLHEETNPRAATNSCASGVPRVVIGRMARFQPSKPAKTMGASPSYERHLSEPFHYGELVQAIEDLLASDDASTRRVA